jgi:integrase/recombinase XerD
MKLFPDAVRIYADESGRLRTPKSRESFMKVMRLLQRQYPSKSVEDFTDEDLTTFCLSRDAAPSTIKNRRAHVKSFFEWAHWKKMTSTNPASNLKFTVVPGRFYVRPGNWLDESQAAAMLRACPSDIQGRRDRIMLMFGFLMGLRAEDIATLEWSMFDPELTTLTIVRKGNKMVTMGIPSQLTTELRTWKASLAMGAKAVLPSSRQVYDPVSGKRKQVFNWDKCLGYNGVLQGCKRAALRTPGVPAAFAPHDLRRSFAGILEKKGVPLGDIQRLMDHENIGTTSRYLDKNPAKRLALTEGLVFDL